MANILIVDDDENIRKYVGRVLESAGHTVTAASGGISGLVKAKLAPPDLIILDISMPHVTGLEALEEFKTSKRTAGVPIVMLTGNTDSVSVQEAMSGYAERYLTKPIDPDELIRQVQEVLNTPRFGV